VSYFHLGADMERPASTLTIKAHSASVPGGVAFTLCDGDGNMLPGQVDCQVENPKMDELGFVTARFLIDGHDVRITA
jgi:hypothetical protein